MANKSLPQRLVMFACSNQHRGEKLDVTLARQRADFMSAGTALKPELGDELHAMDFIKHCVQAPFDLGQP